MQMAEWRRLPIMASGAGNGTIGGSRPGSMGILVVDDKPDALMFREKKSPKPISHNGSSSVTGSATARPAWTGVLLLGETCLDLSVKCNTN